MSDDRARIQVLEAAVRALTLRINGMFAFSRTTQAPGEGGPVQTLQLRHSALELQDAVTRLQDYGYASVPPVGTDVLTMFLGGDRGAGVAFAAGDKASRPRNLGPYDSCLYDQRGRRVQLAAAGVIIDAAGDDVTIVNAGTVTINASVKVRMDTPLLEVTGDIVDRCDSDGLSMEASREVYNSHHHPVPGVEAGGFTATSDPPTEQQ